MRKVNTVKKNYSKNKDVNKKSQNDWSVFYIKLIESESFSPNLI